MGPLEIKLRDTAAAFAPRETVAGTVYWHAEARPYRIEVLLQWHTSGKGVRDTGVAESLTINNPDTSGSRDFSFVLPEGPYSFAGKLVTLTWAVAATAFPGKETTRQEIVVSPTRQLISLYGPASAPADTSSVGS